MSLNLFLVPGNTKVEANTAGQPFDISACQSRTFLCRLTITEQIEQESLDVSIWGSPDGQNFGKTPLLKIPQQFYCGTTKMVLDISLRPEVRFLQAKLDVNRWGRVSPTPMFVVELTLEEVPPMAENTTTRAAVQARS